MIRSYEKTTSFPSKLASARPLVHSGHLNKLSSGLFFTNIYLAMDLYASSGHMASYVVSFSVVSLLLHGCTWYFRGVLSLVVSVAASFLLCACSACCAVLYRVFLICHNVARCLSTESRFSIGAAGNHLASRVAVSLPVVVANQKSCSLCLVTPNLVGLFTFRHGGHAGAFPLGTFWEDDEHRIALCSQLASTRPLVNYRNCRKPSDSLFAFWSFASAWDGHSLFLSWNADVGYQYVYQCVLRRCTYHFCGVLPLVVSDSASVLLRACSVCRAVLYRFFHVCSAIAFRCCGDGSLPGDSIRNHGAPRALGPLPVVVADQNHSPLHLAASGPAGLFAFRHRLYAAAFRLAFSRGRLAFCRPRLPRLPAPSFLSSLFPPTASLSRLRGLSPCPPAFVFGGAA